MRTLKLSVFLLLVLSRGVVFGQQEAYTVPTKVYVGDRASLVLPLPGFAGDGDTEISPDLLPASPELIIHRVVLERRPAGYFLTIDFSAYMPGTLELPALTIAGTTFSGLHIEINSILTPDESGTVLSGPVLPLAIPGTSLLVYGTVSLLVLVILLVSWGLLWGRKRMNGWLTAWKRKRLIVSMMRIERRLRKSLAKGISRREILDELAAEFRSFLAYFTGENCRSMTAAEIRAAIPQGALLGGFFTRCDEIRFCGGDINGNDVLVILDDVKSFLTEIAA